MFLIFVGKNIYRDGQLFIKTLEGDMQVSINNYIIMGVNGELELLIKDMIKEIE